MTKRARDALNRITSFIEGQLRPLDGAEYLEVCDEIGEEGRSRADAYREEHKEE